MIKKIQSGTILYSLLFIVSTLILVVKLDINSNYKITSNDLFNPDLGRLNSTESLVKYVDSLNFLSPNKQYLDTLRYIESLSTVIKERFKHGMSLYSLNDNWISYLSGSIFWDHLMALVLPDDILKHKEGLCSQQTIVFLEVLKRKGIGFRSVGLGYKEGPGHFLCEVYYAGNWHLYDVTKEPDWSKVSEPHKSLQYYLTNNKELLLVYGGNIDANTFFKIMNRVSYGEANKMPAQKMALFHRVTKALTYILPAMFLFLTIRSFRKNKADQVQI